MLVKPVFAIIGTNTAAGKMNTILDVPRLNSSNFNVSRSEWQPCFSVSIITATSFISERRILQAFLENISMKDHIVHHPRIIQQCYRLELRLIFFWFIKAKNISIPNNPKKHQYSQGFVASYEHPVESFGLIATTFVLALFIDNIFWRRNSCSKPWERKD